MSSLNQRRPIGGFFGLSVPPARAGSYLDAWRVPDRRVAFANARSAFRALLDLTGSGAVWLPAYICRDMADAVPRERLRFYSVGQQLAPDVGRISGDVRAGDVVLGIDYFGRPPAADFRDFAASRPDLVFVEDCAQAPLPAGAGWGDWRLFSARKVVGVPDGGFIVPVSARAVAMAGDFAPVRPDIDRVVAAATPALARFEDERETDNASWSASNRRREGGETISGCGISLLSWSLLGGLEAAPDARRRRSNFAVLAERLRDVDCALDRDPFYVPFGFPVQVPASSRQGLLEQLFRQRIYPATHWNDLPSPSSHFGPEHELSRRLLTLPCDQRYDEADMHRVADAVLALAR